MKLSIFKTAIAAFLMALIAVTIAILAGLGHRLGWWHFSTGFVLLHWSVYLALMSLTVSLVGIFLGRSNHQRRGWTWAFVAIVISLSIIIVPLN